MKIFKAPAGFIDVFVGMEWDKHTRLREVKNGSGKKLVYISGNRLNHNQLIKVQQQCR